MIKAPNPVITAVCSVSASLYGVLDAVPCTPLAYSAARAMCIVSAFLASFKLLPVSCGHHDTSLVLSVDLSGTL